MDFMFIFDFFFLYYLYFSVFVSMNTGTSESALLFMSKYTFPVQIRWKFVAITARYVIWSDLCLKYSYMSYTN